MIQSLQLLQLDDIIPATVINFKFDIMPQFYVFTIVWLMSLMVSARPTPENILLQISPTSVKFHANWTQGIETIPAHSLLLFHDAIQSQHLLNLEVSLYRSNLLLENSSEQNEIKAISRIFPGKLGLIENVILNLGGCFLRNSTIQYILSLIPSQVKSLSLNLDEHSSSIALHSYKPPCIGLVQIIVSNLNTLTILTNLKLSLMFSKIGNQGINYFFLNYHMPQAMQSLQLVLCQNELNSEAMKYLPFFIANAHKLQSFYLNLYMNKIQSGVIQIAQSLKQLPHLKSLALDFYLNDLKQNGTKVITEAVSALTHLNQLSINFDLNFIQNQGANSLGNALTHLTYLTRLQIGVANKNFGFNGFQSMMIGLNGLKQIKVLILRCGVNRVGIRGAALIKKMLNSFKQLNHLELNFIENFVGDEGTSLIGQGLKASSSLSSLNLNLGFNDIRSKGLQHILEILASKQYDSLFLGLSNNPFTDQEVLKVLFLIKMILEKNNSFEMEFMGTKISKKVSLQLRELFDQYQSSTLYVDFIENSESTEQL